MSEQKSTELQDSATISPEERISALRAEEHEEWIGFEVEQIYVLPTFNVDNGHQAIDFTISQVNGTDDKLDILYADTEMFAEISMYSRSDTTYININKRSSADIGLVEFSGSPFYKKIGVTDETKKMKINEGEAEFKDSQWKVSISTCMYDLLSVKDTELIDLSDDLFTLEEFLNMEDLFGKVDDDSIQTKHRAEDLSTRINEKIEKFENRLYKKLVDYKFSIEDPIEAKISNYEVSEEYETNPSDSTVTFIIKPLSYESEDGITVTEDFPTSWDLDNMVVKFVENLGQGSIDCVKDSIVYITPKDRNEDIRTEGGNWSVFFEDPSEPDDNENNSDDNGWSLWPF